MSIFSSIKNAIFGKKDEPAAPQRQTGTTAPAGHALAPTQQSAPSIAVDTVDVENRLDSMPGADRLNWRTSIVDLMKLIGVDASLSNRKDLAQELGYTGALDGSAEMNMWLHKKTMEELAANGGKVPADLLD